MKRAILTMVLPMIIFYQSEGRMAKCNDNKTATNNNLLARIFFSTEEPIAGIAKTDTVFSIKAGGGFLYVGIDNHSSPIGADTIRIIVYKKINGSWETVEEVFREIDGKMSDDYFKYTFKTAGLYILNVFGSGSKFIGTGRVEIKNAETHTSYSMHRESKVYFSTKAPIFGTSYAVSSFQMPSGGGSLYVIVDKYPNNFGANSLQVTIYRSKNGKDKKYDRVELGVNEFTHQADFSYTFRKQGDYTFKIYDSWGRYIKSGFISVTNQ